MKKYLINTIIIDGLEGFKIDDLDGLKSFYIPKLLLKKVGRFNNSNNEDLGINNSGIYFLIHKDSKKIYIGQTNNIYDRLITHNRSKEKLEDDGVVIAITTESNSLSKTFIDYLEYHYIQKYNNSQYWNLENKDMRERIPNVGMYDKIKIDEIISKINIILKLNEVSFKKKKINDIRYKENKNEIFYFRKSRVLFDKNDDSIILCENSIIFNSSEDNIWKSNNPNDFNSKERIQLLLNILDLKNVLMKKNLLEIINENECKILSNIKIKSPKTCAILISGNTNVNGWDEFKNSQGLSLNDVYKK